MAFHSATFLLGLVGIVALHWALPWQRARLVLLLAASLIFYGWSHWPSVPLLLISIGVNYGFGRALERWRSPVLLAVAVALNLGLLAYFKYARFLVEQLQHIGLEAQPPSPWAPLGISFFTFQVIAYLVDVSRRTITAERDLLVFAVFKSLFAQLVAGPIVRASELLPQLHRKARFSTVQLHRGVWLIMVGLFLKVGLADTIGAYVDFGWRDPTALGANNAWLVVYGYSAQLLADFWGYSTMAVGLGLLFGLTLPRNFDNPYRATGLRDFWRRWHITLSEWLRDYLYVPLGGSRTGHASRNRLITMALGGLWHGPAWSFVGWGLLHGVGMAVEQRVERFQSRWPSWLKVLLTFHLVTLAWIPFRAPSLSTAVSVLRRLVSPTWDVGMPTQVVVLTAGFLLFQRPLFALIADDAGLRLSVRRELALVLVLILFLLAYGSAKPDFLYSVF